MKRAAWLGGALTLCWMVVGCTTTGDPREGGLFFWSAAEADKRLKEHREHVAGAEAELARESTQRLSLEARDTGAERQIAAAQAAEERARQKLRAQQAALVAKTEELERESLTPATASRARSWRLKINTVVAQTALPVAERSARLDALETEIDSVLARLKN